MQNGSARELHWWGVMNFIESDKELSDTYYLARFLEERGANDFNLMMEVFAELIKKKISLGVIVVYDLLDNNFLLMSDGDRSMYIEFSWENQLEYFSSINDEWSDEYSFIGWLIANNKWEVLGCEFKELNKYKKKYTAPSTSTTQAYSDYYSGSVCDDENYYYRAHRARTQTSLLPWATPPSGRTWQVQEKNKSWNWGTGTTTWNPLNESTVEKKDRKTNILLEEDPRKGKFSDDVELIITDVIETSFLIQLENYINSKYADCTRLVMDWDYWPEYRNMVGAIEAAIDSIREDMNGTKRRWLDGFFDKWSDKYMQDARIFDEYIREKLESVNEKLLNLI